MENLGDRILFLSNGNSVSICASEMGCKGNRAYFIPHDVKRLAECSCCHPGGIYLKSCGKNVPYVEIELGGDGMTTHFIPTHSDPALIKIGTVFGCAWLTPCLR